MRRNSPPLFLAPAIILLVIFIIYPVLSTIFISFLAEDGSFVGAENYVKIIGSRDIVNTQNIPGIPPYGALIHNLIWIIIHLPLSLMAGLILAIILRDVKGSSIVKSIIFLGMVTPMIVGGLIIRFTFQEGVGIVNGFFELIGFEELTKTWTAYPDTALFALIFGSVWLWTGFSMTLYLAGLASIPKEIYEAAKMDGAGPIRTFVKITLPLLRPITIVVITMSILYELKIFDIVFAATLGGPGGASSVLALEMWRYAFIFVEIPSHINLAAVIASLLTIMTMVVTIPLIKYVVTK
jgi:multiple sugar transport system permease protein